MHWSRLILIVNKKLCYRRATVRRACQYRLESQTYHVALFAFSHFDTIPECDRHTDRHITTAYTALSIASRGKNRPNCMAHKV